MEERKKKFPKSYMSKQQKEIVKIVCENYLLPARITNKTILSWDIARKFDDGKRIVKNKNEENILSKSHRASMSRSLKTLKERDFLEDFGTKTHFGATEKGFNWCELNVNGFKERKKGEQAKKLLEREKITKNDFEQDDEEFE